MGATLTRKPSQKAFEKALRKHLERREQIDTAVPDFEQVRRGVELAALDAIRDRLGLSQETLERTLSVSTRTLQRRRNAEYRLTPAESDRLWRLLHVFELALEAFEQNEDAARSWLTTPKALLSGETPLDRLDTEPGLREVEDMLTVIDETGAA
jgi:putative toxin-antitoxin system antitoxin component (TIGR02293 family)